MPKLHRSLRGANPDAVAGSMGLSQARGASFDPGIPGACAGAVVGRYYLSALTLPFEEITFVLL
jgi:hypothetical protein